eukprot:TRINITY_DN67614_c0_g1_i1.p1 TRINITY_DN67614_c0_g1~~TRINITY_DN67614_c0_g1_i1.p1  ORF type:complete len:200 (-),score=37.35 TRINITY_DN67614_c0_g1_i1:102-701(-)
MKSGERTKPADRAEQMRQRLAARAAGGGARQSGPFVHLPAPKAVLVAGKSLSWLLWALSAASLVLSLITGFGAISVTCFVFHTGYFANFSRTDLALQVRLLAFMWVAVGTLLGPLRVALYIAMLGLISTDLAIGYNGLERVLYLIPMNRADNPEEFSIDFVIRVFTEPPSKKSQVFSLKPLDTADAMLGAPNSGKKTRR